MSTQTGVALDHSFSPIVGERARLLILGSLPGKRSIAEQGYYAHPRNAFWPIMSQLLGFDCHLPYEARVERLRQHRIALWDVVASAQRPGSLDSDIVRQGAKYNAIPELIKRCNTIELIAFNGNAAADLFKRAQQTWQMNLERIELVRLPSTSPAHAAMSFEQKRDAWKTRLKAAIQ